MQIVLLTEGSGASRAHELSRSLDAGERLDVVVPVTRDHWAHGLKCCPDVDAFVSLPRTDPPTYAVADELAAVGFSPSWMRPSDGEIALRIVRTELLQAGYGLGEATLAMATRAALPFGLHPASDDRAELHVVLDEPDGPRAVHVAEQLADPSAHRPLGATIVATGWELADRVREVVSGADVLLLGPSTPVHSVDPLLATPGLREAMTAPVLELGPGIPGIPGVLAAARAAAGARR